MPRAAKSPRPAKPRKARDALPPRATCFDDLPAALRHAVAFSSLPWTDDEILSSWRNLLLTYRAKQPALEQLLRLIRREEARWAGATPASILRFRPPCSPLAASPARRRRGGKNLPQEIPEYER